MNFWVNFQNLSMISRLSVLVLIFFSSSAFSDVENPCKAVFVEKKKELNAELIESVENKDIKKIKSLLNQGAEVNSADEEGTTVLMSAGFFGYVKIVELLILEGANLNTKDIYGDTAFIKAVFSKNWKVMDLLWENGADISVKNKFGDTALSWAKKHKDPDMIEYLEEALELKELEEIKKLREITEREQFPATLLKASEIARKAGIKSGKEYRDLYEELGLPAHPDKHYKSDWQGWGHFLGTRQKKGRTKKNFPAFEVAIQRVQQAGITTKVEYGAKYKELGLPSSPRTYYRGKWKNWGYFLGTGRIVGKNFPTFEVAIQRVQQAGITIRREYQAKCKELGLPFEPSCLVAGEAEMIYKVEKTKEELWDKYYTQAPAQRRQLVERYKIVKRA